MKTKKSWFLFFIGLTTFLHTACYSSQNNSTTASKTNSNMNTNIPLDATSLDTLTLGAGCFWCVEAVFQRVKGIEKVVSGYMGGTLKNPTYREVCTGRTGHAEVIQLSYDPAQISVAEILAIFFGTHDPTTLNRQGADVGTQYRSVIFYHTEAQAQAARQIIAELEKEKIFPDPIVTEVTPASVFYKAEDYHQNYYNNNQSQPYCSFVITPKIEKLKKYFSEKLKK
jgi:peptide-methionine (S)-S-oxide reductase